MSCIVKTKHGGENMRGYAETISPSIWRMCGVTRFGEAHQSAINGHIRYLQGINSISASERILLK